MYAYNDICNVSLFVNIYDLINVPFLFIIINTVIIVTTTIILFVKLIFYLYNFFVRYRKTRGLPWCIIMQIKKKFKKKGL